MGAHRARVRPRNLAGSGLAASPTGADLPHRKRNGIDTHAYTWESGHPVGVCRQIRVAHPPPSGTDAFNTCPASVRIKVRVVAFLYVFCFQILRVDLKWCFLEGLYYSARRLPSYTKTRLVYHLPVPNRGANVW